MPCAGQASALLADTRHLSRPPPPNKYCTAPELMSELSEVTFEDLGVEWPPTNHDEDSEVGDGASSGSQGQPGRGTCGRGKWGWGRIGVSGSQYTYGWVKRLDELGFHAEYDLPPGAPRNRCGMEGGQVWVCTTDSSSLLVTSDSSCRDTTAEELEEFLSSKAASDGDRFDIYLSCGREEVELYGLLAPSTQRLTGQLRCLSPPPPAAAAVAGAVSVNAQHQQQQQRV